ncbi:Ubiquinol-cytochrome C chaperone [Nesidiocoris tenuis]|uniref:Ubiquinol-cytochrome C chaperone n=1 Tax=Nesidiocoris tenuis TaxID=355587 RepID=A0ABN7AJM9_9HEMI|nr:Ubiquinol-cytochrome C chaperone [Nesidiocoris tenuis]
MNVHSISRLYFRHSALLACPKINFHHCSKPKFQEINLRCPHTPAYGALLKMPDGILVPRTVSTETFGIDKRDGFGQSIKKRIRTYIRTTKLRAAGFKLYEQIADQIDYATFMTKLELPDTFYSWFMITELHVWMLMARLMANPYDGRSVRNNIVEALWKDVTTRAKQLGPEHSSVVRSQISELNQGFQAALVLYDEGLLSSDKVLACALWRRFFNRNCSSAHQLELMVLYVRHTIRVLDSIELEDLVNDKRINWIPIEKAIEEQKKRANGEQ